MWYILRRGNMKIRYWYQQLTKVLGRCKVNAKILEVIANEINPVLSEHGGSCQLVGVEDNVVTVRLLGGCAGCPSAKLTMMNGVVPLLKDNIPEIKDVLLEG
jgi:Fe-S cluster biogenesis protein NfuA